MSQITYKQTTAHVHDNNDTSGARFSQTLKIILEFL